MCVCVCTFMRVCTHACKRARENLPASSSLSPPAWGLSFAAGLPSGPRTHKCCCLGSFDTWDPVLQALPGLSKTLEPSRCFLLLGGPPRGMTVPRLCTRGLLCRLLYRCPVPPSTRVAGRSSELRMILRQLSTSMSPSALMAPILTCPISDGVSVWAFQIRPQFVWVAPFPASPQFSPGLACLHYPCSLVVTSHHQLFSSLLAALCKPQGLCTVCPCQAALRKPQGLCTVCPCQRPKASVSSQGTSLFLRSQSMPLLNPF